MGNRLVGKEIINIQMKGRVYVPLENLNTAETEKLHLDDVFLFIDESNRCRMIGSLLEWSIDE